MKEFQELKHIICQTWIKAVAVWINLHNKCLNRAEVTFLEVPDTSTTYSYILILSSQLTAYYKVSWVLNIISGSLTIYPLFNVYQIQRYFIKVCVLPNVALHLCFGLFFLHFCCWWFLFCFLIVLLCFCAKCALHMSRVTS